MQTLSTTLAQRTTHTRPYEMSNTSTTAASDNGDTTWQDIVAFLSNPKMVAPITIGLVLFFIIIPLVIQRAKYKQDDQNKKLIESTFVTKYNGLNYRGDMTLEDIDMQASKATFVEACKKNPLNEPKVVLEKMEAAIKAFSSTQEGVSADVRKENREAFLTKWLTNIHQDPNTILNNATNDLTGTDDSDDGDLEAELQRLGPRGREVEMAPMSPFVSNLGAEAKGSQEEI